MSEMDDTDRAQIRDLQNSFAQYKIETTEALRQLQMSFAQMQGTLQRIATTISGDPENDIDGIVVKVRKLDDHEGRIKKLESDHVRIMAYSAAIAVILSTLFSAGKLAFELMSR
jgi:hypothetical protein